jgi:SAM-dependent methyltransferase/NAD(P)-dependent dehydrogenase (short-subunit alcohol dehydrogenase family)/acyl carrier protein
MLSSLGQLWASGATVDWEGFHRTERRARVSLPTYPFERQSYWIGARPGEMPAAAQHEVRDTADWFYRPIWREVPPIAATADALAARRILVFDEGTGLGQAVLDAIRDAGGEAIAVRQSDAFSRLGDHEYRLDPADAEAWTRLAHDVCAASNRLAGVIDCWSAAPPGTTNLDAAAVVTLLGPLRLAHALSSQATVRPLPLLLVARGTARVKDDDRLDPPRALGAGSAKVIPQEHPGLRVTHIDVDADSRAAGMIVAELVAGAREPTLALRGGHRFAETYEPTPIRTIGAPLDLPERPVVMVTGGLGHMGMGLSEGLFDRLGARLVLLGRTALPAPDEWASASEDQALSAERRTLLRRLAKLHERRDEVLVVNADMNDPAQVEAAVDTAVARFGPIDLVIHGAARIDAAAFGSVADTGHDVVEAQFSPKLRGLLSLIAAFRGREARRWVLHSSISTVLGGLGLAAYSAANAMLDAIAIQGGKHWLSVDWDLWDNAGEAQAVSMPLAIHPPEGQDAFLRLLGTDVGARVLIVASDLAGRLKAWVRHEEAPLQKGAAIARHPRPNLATAYIEPRTKTEHELADIWGDQLGIASIGIHDRFFDLGGHSLLAVQVSTAIRDRFDIEMPVLKLFQAPTIGELAVLIDQAWSSERVGAIQDSNSSRTDVEAAPLVGDAPTVAAKSRHREFYDDVTRRLEQSGVGEASFFLNYGYLPLGGEDEAHFEVPDGVFNPSSIRLAFELIGRTNLNGCRVLDVGCGRGGTAALIAEHFDADVTGVDLSTEGIAFCRRTHRHPRVRFDVGDAEHVPVDDRAFDVVTNVESSHTYPNLRAFFSEVSRVLVPGGLFLYTDLLPVQRWMEVRVLLGPLGFTITDDRHITPNVLASCDQVATTRAQAFGGSSALMDNFLAVPGSAVYEQMRSGAWEYRILRARRS